MACMVEVTGAANLCRPVMRGQRLGVAVLTITALSSLAGDGAAGSGSSSTGGGICRFPTDRVVTTAGTPPSISSADACSGRSR